jgi:2-keto-4-pentenoate hydratase/2-oxohepta-3-ene-1,7-dioic acid hydratase in catechol pathway
MLPPSGNGYLTDEIVENSVHNIKIILKIYQETADLHHITRKSLAGKPQSDYILEKSGSMRSIRIHNTDRKLTVGKILCLGRNYADHAGEMKSEVPGVPMLFLKPPTAMNFDGGDIVFPPISRELHHEVELVFVIGKNGKFIPASRAGDHILGYAIGLDMTLRDVQTEAKSKGLPWTGAKGFDTSAPLSEIILKEQMPGPQELTIRCSVNGKVRQESPTSLMIFSPEKIIEYASSIFTLEEGDLFFTGTPKGVGPVAQGDTIEAEIVGVVHIAHRVVVNGKAS